MGWAASPGAGPRDGERVARRGRAWTLDRCAEVTAARTGPTTQSSTVQTPHCGGLRVPAAGPRGRRKGPAGLTPRAAGRAPGRAGGPLGGRRPHPPIAPLSIYLQIYNMRHDTCALLVAGPCTTVRRPDRDATREDRRTRPISEHARETRRAGPHALTYRRDHTHTARDMRITHGSRMPCTYSPG